VGTVAGIPLNALIDCVWRGAAFGPRHALGAASVGAGFLLMVLSQTVDEWAATRRCGSRGGQEGARGRAAYGRLRSREG
jgi:hypothetical protein